MAKASGKVNQKPPRVGKRLGIKKTGGEEVASGNIIIRQRGSTFHPGKGTLMAKDFTIQATEKGKVNFKTLKGKKIVEVI
ncbi:MAG: 50S ribosomal protein L27 [Microgenomates group bacterium ADurb.Bin219]|nr:MAG: 50S ribosomal protein L27 [Microgenomates group bacterium ADurb.Bin219]HNP89624.1 50S ribosomal protein L27 [Candidatus Woesebacteria bacterium]